MAHGQSRWEGSNSPRFHAAQKIYGDFIEARTARQEYDYRWYVYDRWYTGHTDVFFEAGVDGGRGTVVQSNRGRGRRREPRSRPINLIGDAIDKLVAKQMKQRPVWSGVPGTPEMADKLSARAARDLLDHYWEFCNITSLRKVLFTDRNVFGNGFLKPSFDQHHPKGPVAMDPEMGTCPHCAGAGQVAGMGPEVMGFAPAPEMCPMCEEGQVKVGETERMLGDIKMTCARPFEIYPHPAARTVEDAIHIFHAHRSTAEDVSKRFDIPIDEVRPTAALEGEAESDFARRARMHRVHDDDENIIWVIEKWMPPLPGERRPRVGIVAGNRLVYPQPDTPNDEQGRREGWVRVKETFGRIPIYHFKLREDPERFWGLSRVEEQISANDTVNRHRQTTYRHLVMMAHVKWLVQAATVKPSSLTNLEGERVEYEGEHAPKQSQIQGIPDVYERLASTEKEYIYELAGLTQIDRGIAPPNIEAAEALGLLLEQSETTHGPVSLEDNREWKELGRAILKICKAWFRPEDKRYINVVGSGNDIEVKALTMSSISDSTDVVVKTDSPIGQSLALRRSAVIDAMQQGAFADNPSQGLQLLEFGIEPGQEDSERRLQEATAYAEHEAMAQGVPHAQLTIMGVTNHKVHARIHREEALVALAAGDTQRAQILGQAIIEHLQAGAPPPQMGPQPAGGAPPPTPAGAPPDAGSIGAPIDAPVGSPFDMTQGV